MNTGTVCRWMCLLLGAIVLICTCKTDRHGRAGKTGEAEESVEESVEWTPRERHWLDGESAEDFRALMLHLERSQPTSDRRLEALEAELEEWPDRERVAPDKWSRRIASGEEVEIAELVELARVWSFAFHELEAEDLRELVDEPEFVKLLESDEVVGLDLRHNYLEGEAIVPLLELDAIASLTYLDLGHNTLGDEGISAVAEAENLENLTRLGLASTSSDTLPEPDVYAKLGGSPHLRGLTHLELSDNQLIDRTLVAFAEDLEMSELVHLGLSENSLGPGGAEALADAPNLKQLAHLDLAQSDISDQGARHLAESPDIARLEYLDLSDNDIGTEGAKHLGESSQFTRLEHLELGKNDIGAPGIAALANAKSLGSVKHLGLRCEDQGKRTSSDSRRRARKLVKTEHLTKLRHLDLQNCRLGRAGVDALSSAPFMEGLHSLDVTGNEIDNTGVSVLLEDARELRRLDLTANFGFNTGGVSDFIALPTIEKLEELSLDFTKIGDEGVALLASTERLENLERLDLGNMRLSEKSVRSLVQAPFMPRLRELNLASNRIGDEGAKVLASSSTTGNLHRLNLGQADLGAPGAKALAKSPHFDSLVELDLGMNPIGDEGAAALAQSRKLEGLEMLDVMTCEIGQRGAAFLQTSPYISCEVIFQQDVRCDGGVKTHQKEKNRILCRRKSANGCYAVGHELTMRPNEPSDVQKGLAYLQKACEMDHALGCNNHAWTSCHDRDRCDEDVLENARKGVELATRENSPIILDTLAYVLCRRGRSEESNEVYERVCEVDPESEACGNSCD
ncbi:MAG: hypothetical protein ACOCV2_10785 [Persicimonas sp.]